MSVMWIKLTMEEAGGGFCGEVERDREREKKKKIESGRFCFMKVAGILRFPSAGLRVDLGRDEGTAGDQSHWA